MLACHPCWCVKSLILDPQAHLSPQRVCTEPSMWVSLQPCSPTGHSSIGLGALPLNADDHCLFHVSQGRYTHMHAHTQKIVSRSLFSVYSNSSKPTVHIGWGREETTSGLVPPSLRVLSLFTTQEGLTHQHFRASSWLVESTPQTPSSYLLQNMCLQLPPVMSPPLFSFWPLSTLSPLTQKLSNILTSWDSEPPWIRGG